MKWAEHVASMGDNVLVTEERRPLGRAGRRWEDNIEVYIKEIGW
jgi:hypothetical protein